MGPVAQLSVSAVRDLLLRSRGQQRNVRLRAVHVPEVVGLRWTGLFILASGTADQTGWIQANGLRPIGAIVSRLRFTAFPVGMQKDNNQSHNIKMWG